MIFSLEFKDLIYLLSVFLGLITGLILFVFGILKKKPNILIGLSYLCLSYSVFLVFLINSGYHSLLPQLYRTGNLTGFLFAPLAYLFIRQILEGRSLKFLDLIHALPFLVFLVDFFPIIFFTSLSEKAQLIQSEISDPSVFVNFNQSRFFPSNFYTLARTSLIFLYWLASAIILIRHGKSEPKNSSQFGKEWILWMKIYLGSSMLFFVPYLIFFSYADSDLAFDLIHFSAGIVILINSLMVLFFPKVLYGMDEEEFILSKEPIDFGIKKEEELVLSAEKLADIQQKVNRIIDQDQIYLQNGLTLSEFAKQSHVPIYLLSYYLNRILGTAFTDLINKKRIEESCKLIDQGALKELTLEGLGLDCGFNNRNSFIASFKKFKGMKPSEYAKGLQKNYQE